MKTKRARYIRKRLFNMAFILPLLIVGSLTNTIFKKGSTSKRTFVMPDISFSIVSSAKGTP